MSPTSHSPSQAQPEAQTKPSVDAGTDANRDEMQAVFDYASSRFGADSDAARLVGARLLEIETALAVATAANTNDKPESQQTVMLTDGLLKSPVLLVGLGITVLGAFMGFSTLFIGMLAAKWLTF